MKRLLALFLLAALGAAAQTATFVKLDTKTGSLPQGTYGSQGAIVALSTAAKPSFSVFATSGNSSWTWGSGETCWYSAGSFTVTVGVADGLTHQVTLYAVDGDSTTRTESVSVPGAATQQLSSFSGGAYLVYEVTGTATFTITHTGGGANAVLTAVYFDAGLSATAPPPVTVACPTPVHSATLAWQASPAPGVTSYTVMRNGVQIASVAATATLEYTDMNLTAGAVLTYSINAITPSGTTPAAMLPAITVPSP